MVSLKLGFFTPEVWVATNVVCAREKMGHEPKKVLNKILDPLWTSSKMNLGTGPEPTTKFRCLITNKRPANRAQFESVYNRE
jgi:hypothetical protein